MAKALLGNGLGDPRGGTFCEVTVDFPETSPFTGNPTNYGWVKPHGKTVVLLNGLEFPLRAIIRKANLEAIKGGSEPSPVSRYFSPFDPTMVEVTPAVLIAAGRPDLARIVYKDYCAGRHGHDSNLLSEAVFSQIKYHVAEALRANRDLEALRWAKNLLKVARVLEAQGIMPTEEELQPFQETQLDFALELASYLDERAKRPSKQPQGVTPSTEITQLIARMDMIQGQQIHKLNPNINYTGDPIYSAILGKGNSAVPALIDALDRDRRFTAFFSVAGGMSTPTNTIHPVAEIIEELLTRIWPSSQVCFSDDREATVEALRKAWVLDSKRSKFEQWAEVLAADNPTPRAWLQAAQHLVNPRVRIYGYMDEPVNSDLRSPLAAAPLQATRGGEIGGLMAKRAIQLVKRKHGEASEMDDCEQALSIGECLSFWSPSTCLPALQELTHLAGTAMTNWTNSHLEHGQLCSGAFSRVISYRLHAGDRTAIADLGRVVHTFKPHFSLTVSELKPLWMLPNDPEMRGVVDKYMRMFKKEIDSPDVSNVVSLDSALLEVAINSPLLTFASFRKVLAAGCGNTASGIEAWTSDGKSLEYNVPNRSSGGFGVLSFPAEVPLSKHFSVTAGDFVAQRVGDLAGAPPYCMIWPNQRRREAKTALKKWLLDDTRDWLKVAKLSPRYSDGD